MPACDALTLLSASAGWFCLLRSGDERAPARSGRRGGCAERGCAVGRDQRREDLVSFPEQGLSCMGSPSLPFWRVFASFLHVLLSGVSWQAGSEVGGSQEGDGPAQAQLRERTQHSHLLNLI
jgi:hypothetical protein